MILVLQIVSIVFALIMIYFAYMHYLRRELNSLEFFSWLLIWIITIGIVMFPQLLQTVTITFAIARVFDLMVIGGFIIVIVVVYLAYIRTKRMEKKIEEYVRKEALLGIKKKNK